MSKLRRQYLGAVLYLRHHLRVRYGHHLCRHYRTDGALVSRSARACDGACRGRLRFRCVLHQFSDRQHGIKSSGYAHTLVVWGIIQGVIGIIAAQWLRVPPEGWQPEGYTPCDGLHRAIAAQLHTAGNAEEPRFLSSLHHDEPNVYLRTDGDIERRTVRTRVQRCTGARARHGGVAIVADALARHKRSDTAILWLGVRSPSDAR